MMLLPWLEVLSGRMHVTNYIPDVTNDSSENKHSDQERQASKNKFLKYNQQVTMKFWREWIHFQER